MHRASSPRTYLSIYPPSTAAYVPACGNERLASQFSLQRFDNLVLGIHWQDYPLSSRQAVNVTVPSPRDGVVAHY